MLLWCPHTGGMRRFLLVLLSAVVVACGMSSDVPGDAGSSRAPVGVDGDLRVDRLVSGLDGPTQMVRGPDGRLWVAQLAGGENAGEGQVVAVDTGSGEQEVLVDGLTKPTGIAWLDDSLWIATPTSVLRARGNPPGEPQIVLDDLLNNGRSNGTLTITPRGRLLFETSGRERAGSGLEGSGALWVVDPADPDQIEMRASGLKNAYAHVFDADGRLWTTEVAEPIGGSSAPDEIDRVIPGDDYGWPACVGDRVPVEAFDGDRDRCARTAAPHTTFSPVGATPTSIVVSPFDDGRFVVALWNADRVVTVPISGDGEVADLLGGISRPQHLLVDGDALLVSEHTSGTVWRVSERG